MYNFGNMNRDQHQGREDEESPPDSDQKSPNVAGCSIILIIAILIGGYFYCNRSENARDAAADPANNSAPPAGNQDSSVNNRPKPANARR